MYKTEEMLDARNVAKKELHKNEELHNNIEYEKVFINPKDIQYVKL